MPAPVRRRGAVPCDEDPDLADALHVGVPGALGQVSAEPDIPSSCAFSPRRPGEKPTPERISLEVHPQRPPVAIRAISRWLVGPPLADEGRRQRLGGYPLKFIPNAPRSPFERYPAGLWVRRSQTRGEGNGWADIPSKFVRRGPGWGCAAGPEHGSGDRLEAGVHGELVTDDTVSSRR